MLFLFIAFNLLLSADSFFIHELHKNILIIFCAMAKLKTKELIEQMQNISIVQLKKRICGEQIGIGLYRDVYVLKSNPDYVVKIERDMSTSNFANVTEWRNYINNREWKWLADWLAPCEMINTNGQVMIQRRVEHRKRKDYPKYIPAVFTDLKLRNFGWIGEQFVCCDYSFIPFYFIKVGKSKMKYAKWWGTLKLHEKRKGSAVNVVKK